MIMGVKNEDIGIKDYIEKVPEVVKILDEYKLSCKTCKRNCLVKNIPEMESFSLQKDMDFTKKIAELENSI